LERESHREQDEMAKLVSCLRKERKADKTLLMYACTRKLVRMQILKISFSQPMASIPLLNRERNLSGWLSEGFFEIN
jgi:hypothetical protein